MTKREAKRVKVGDVLQMKRTPGRHFTVMEIVNEHPNPRVRVPLFRSSDLMHRKPDHQFVTYFLCKPVEG